MRIGARCFGYRRKVVRTAESTGLRGSWYGLSGALELDSMDFLDIVMELRRRYKVNIPEEEYTALGSMNSTVEYLAPKMAEL